MLNEKDVRSRSGGDSAGKRECGNYRSNISNLPFHLVQRIRTLSVHLEACIEDCEWINDFDEYQRIWPQPTIRQVKRNLQAQLCELERILK